MIRDFLTIEPASNPALEHVDEVQGEVERSLAAEIQGRLRARLDPGIDLRAAQRAQAVRATAEAGRIIVREESQESILGGEQPASHRAARGHEGVSSLFVASRRAPAVIRDRSGRERLVFRQLDEAHLFSDDEARDRLVDQVAGEVLVQRVVDAYEQAIRTVALRHPSEKVR